MKPQEELDQLDLSDVATEPSLPMDEAEEDSERPLGDVPPDEQGNTECEYITGAAGTGKTWLIRQRLATDRRYGVLCATTGIAAVNLDTTTINSLLSYFDTDSLQDNYLRGWLTERMRQISRTYKRITIDEISMMPKEQLDLIVRAADEINESGEHTLGLVLTGDFCQLPPVNADFCFKAESWPKFARNITRLTKVWRQGDERFLEAINAVRSGDGLKGAALLRGMVEFSNFVDINFQGTTIFDKNIAVDRHNAVALTKLKGRDIFVRAKRWGKQRGEWKNIPDVLKLKENAYVMILTNDPPGGFVNGDCGHVVSYDEAHRAFVVKLVRNGREVYIQEITRCAETKEKPSGADDSQDRDANKYYPLNGNGAWRGVYRSRTSGKVIRTRWIQGQIEYFPIRLAYACTVHKSQGLSLDRVQLDCRGAFFGSPAMLYVALSRARTPEGLRVVGAPDTLARRVKIHPEVLHWL
jgi:ATP-dependent DNA helicase PIF1